MSTFDTFLNADVVLLPVAYLAATVAYAFVFFARHPRAETLAPWLLRATLLLHLGLLVGLGVRWGQFPAANIPQGVSVVAFAVALTYSLVEWRGRERSTGFWIVGAAFVLQLLGSILYRPEGIDREILHNPAFAAHASLALVAYASFVIAGSYGFLFLRLYRELKSGSFSLFYGRLPSLEALDRMMFGTLQIGVAALTGSAVIGAVWAARLYAETGETWWTDPIILLTFVLWTFYCAILVLRWLRRWQGRQTALACLGGLGLIVLSLLFLNFVVGDFHGPLPPGEG